MEDVKLQHVCLEKNPGVFGRLCRVKKKQCVDNQTIPPLSKVLLFFFGLRTISKKGYLLLLGIFRQFQTFQPVAFSTVICRFNGHIWVANYPPTRQEMSEHHKSNYRQLPLSPSSYRNWMLCLSWTIPLGLSHGNPKLRRCLPRRCCGSLPKQWWVIGWCWWRRVTVLRECLKLALIVCCLGYPDKFRVNIRAISVIFNGPWSYIAEIAQKNHDPTCIWHRHEGSRGYQCTNVYGFWHHLWLTYPYWPILMICDEDLRNIKITGPYRSINPKHADKGMDQTRNAPEKICCPHGARSLSFFITPIYNYGIYNFMTDSWLYMILIPT